MDHNSLGSLTEREDPNPNPLPNPNPIQPNTSPSAEPCRYGTRFRVHVTEVVVVGGRGIACACDMMMRVLYLDFRVETCSFSSASLTDRTRDSMTRKLDIEIDHFSLTSQSRLLLSCRPCFHASQSQLHSQSDGQSWKSRRQRYRPERMSSIKLENPLSISIRATPPGPRPLSAPARRARLLNSILGTCAVTSTKTDQHNPHLLPCRWRG